MDINPEWLGIPAAILTTAAYIPQTLKVLRDKHTRDLSLGMYVLITAGIFCWFLYGILLNSPSMIVANGISFVLSGFILLMKLKYR